MTERVSVCVRGTQIPADGGEETVTVSRAEGSCRRVADAWHILYEESLGDADVRAKTHLVIRDDALELHRRGAADADFLFEEGRECALTYRTADGGIDMRVRTSYLVIRELTGELSAEIHYAILSGDMVVADSRVEIAVRDV